MNRSPHPQQRSTATLPKPSVSPQSQQATSDLDIMISFE